MIKYLVKCAVMMLRNIFEISETVERSLNYSTLLENINILTRLNYVITEID